METVAPAARDKHLKSGRRSVARRLLSDRLMRCVLLMVVAACTSDAGGSVTGQVPGGSFDPGATISAAVMIPDGGGEAVIVVSSVATACSDDGAAPPIERKGSRAMTIRLMDVANGMTTTPAAPGTYTIYPNSGSQPPKEALLEMYGLDDTCQQVDAQSAQGQSGSVTLTSVAGGVFKGTFDVTLNTGDHLTGSFDPTACAALASLAANPQSPACD
jgi:hypothetical protein